jgi:hypothetical protein
MWAFPSTLIATPTTLPPSPRGLRSFLLSARVWPCKKCVILVPFPQLLMFKYFQVSPELLKSLRGNKLVRKRFVAAGARLCSRRASRLICVSAVGGGHKLVLIAEIPFIAWACEFTPGKYGVMAPPFPWPSFSLLALAALVAEFLVVDNWFIMPILHLQQGSGARPLV